ncbi:MAG: formylglycine-generating enzyme family protein, partial [Elusimicrobiota bacterium]
EWEYAARSGGRDRKFPWGNEKATCERAVISEGDDGALGCGKNSTWPVCSKPAGNTRQGLCDMAGNAWEWVQDRFHNSYAGAPADGNSREGPGANRVVRGGSFRLSAENARCALRGGVPGDRDFTLGFRPARAIPARRLKQE